MKRYLLLLYLLSSVLFNRAQDFVANAPTHVATGENFRLTYMVNSENVSDFRIGNIPEALEVITGPYTSSQSSYQYTNGHTSSYSSTTYTFILCASKSGNYTITPAHIVANGKRLASKTLHIKVTGNSKNNTGAPKMHDDSEEQPQIRQAGSAISGSDLFIKVTASKRRVHEQEPVLLTYKVYTLVDLTQLEGKMPDLTGFHTQEIPLPQQKSYHIERVNGRPYRCVTWSQYVMYPQMTGKLEIPSITFNGTVIQQNRDVDPFEAFFNGGSGYIEVKRSIKAPGLTIQVDPLPKRPANFSGGVGKFNISAQINKTEVKANDPVSIRIVVGGIGNLKLIKQPQLNVPKDFDKYDAKVTDKTKLTANGIEGNMVYDFLVVPRNQGSYDIPPVEFTYYDASANVYKTIKTQSFKLKVSKGKGISSSSAAYSDMKNQDIRPLKNGDINLIDVNNLFFGSVSYWIMLTFLVAVFAGLLVTFRKRAIENANISKLRSKKANRIATKRLRNANKLMLANESDKFYDEVLRTLWGYIGDKLDIPVERLSKDNISEKLSDQGVDEETVSKFIQAIDECEYNRYAPGDVKGNMNMTFETAMTAIITIEDVMKNSRKSRVGEKVFMLMLVLVICTQTVGAVTKKNADDEYAKGNYQQAIRDYEDLLKRGVSVNLYYNLGNAYYRTDNITRAIINYERALILSPGDNDIRFNLQLARSKTIDKIMPKSEMFFVTWYSSLVNLMSVDGWAWTAVISISLALVLVLCYLFANRMTLKKVGFYGAVLFFLMFVFSNISAYWQMQMLTERTGAIIIEPSAAMRKTPVDNSGYTTIVHEGTRIEITDDTMKDWKCVELADGREGWIKASQMERI